MKIIKLFAYCALLFTLNSPTHSLFAYSHEHMHIWEDPDSLKEASCSGHHSLFQQLPKVRPLTVRSLGDRPQFNELIGLNDPDVFFKTLKDLPNNKKVPGNDLEELESLFQAVGYSGVEDPNFTLARISPIHFPNGISGIMGNEKHDYRFSVIAYKENQTIPGWKIEAENGCDFYFLSACGNAFNPFSVACTEPISYPMNDKIKVSVKNTKQAAVAFDLEEEQIVSIPIVCRDLSLNLDTMTYEEIIATCKVIDTQEFKLTIDLQARGDYSFESNLDTTLNTHLQKTDQANILLSKGGSQSLKWSNINYNLEPLNGYLEVACGDCKKEQFLRIAAGATILKNEPNDNFTFGRLYTASLGYESPSLGNKCKEWTLSVDALIGFQENEEVLEGLDFQQKVSGIYAGLSATLNYYVSDSLEVGGGLTSISDITFLSKNGDAKGASSWKGLHFEVTKWGNHIGYFAKIGILTQSYRNFSHWNPNIQIGLKKIIPYKRE